MASNYFSSDSDESSDEELILLALCAESDKSRIWVHETNILRPKLGEFHQLIQELKNHPDRFFEYFRMPLEKFDELVEKLTPTLQLQSTNWREPICVEQQIAVTLRFLSTGDSFKTIAFSFRLGHSTVRKFVFVTCKALWDVLVEELLPVPSEELWRKNARMFQERWNFPHCIGAIDGKHVMIQAPPNSGSLYFNYKGTYSIVLMAVVNADYCFTAVDIGAYGGRSDGGILQNSNLGQALETNTMSVPPPEPLQDAPEIGPLPYVIVGDEAFPLKKYMMRPFPGKRNPENKKIFNYRLSRARRISENAFGLLTQRWRIFQRRLNLFPTTAEAVVKAAVILHNFIQHDRTPNLGMDDDGMPVGVSTAGDSSDNARVLAPMDLVYRGNRCRRDALEDRDKFMEYFTSPTGEVPWQYTMVRQ